MELALLCVLLVYPSVFGLPDAGAQVAAIDLKAAFLYNFAKFIEWPESAPVGDASTFLICVSGEAEHAAAAARLLHDKQVQGHPVATRVVATVDDAKPCRVLFVEAGDAHFTDRSWQFVTALPILTVGEAEGFLSGGGIINLLLEDGRLRFEINPQAAARAHLKISSKLLKLGRIVDTP